MVYALFYILGAILSLLIAIAPLRILARLGQVLTELQRANQWLQKIAELTAEADAHRREEFESLPEAQ